MNWENSELLPLDMSKLDLPITAVFPNQGLFITRSDWSDEAAYLNVLARHDAWYDRHENVDRGRFVFAALGRRWAIDRPWAEAKASSDHSLVHIDGLAQAEAKVGRGKAPNARLIRNGDLGLADGAGSDRPGMVSYAVVDLKNAYDWLWSHSWKQPGAEWEPEARSFAELGWKSTRPGQPPALHGADDEASPQYNFEGCNLWRSSYNPVKYCWRTTVLVREPNPYVMIVDDVKKDDQERLYQWYMPVPDDVEFEPLADGRILLTEKSERRTYDRANVGSRRLLISPMGPNRPSARLEEYTSGLSRTKAYKARRLVLSIQADAGKFRVVLYPFRTTLEPAGSRSRQEWTQFPLGAEIPEFSAPAAGGFWMKLAAEKHQWSFPPGEDGRSRLKLQRGGDQWRID